VLFVGVAGGIKDVAIGDVVVAEKVYCYHAGKAEDEFKTRPEVAMPRHRIFERARAESRKLDWLKRLSPSPSPAPQVFLGAIAAGEQVVTSTQSESYKLIRKAYNDALAVEMESYGFLDAAQGRSRLEALAVRGISDLLEGKAEADNSGSQERASRHAAAFAFEVLAKLILPDNNIRTENCEVPVVGSARDKKAGDQIVTTSGGSVAVQNSPGAQVSIQHALDLSETSSKQLEQLIQTNQMLVSTIHQLITQQHVPARMRFTPAGWQDADHADAHIVVQIEGVAFPVSRLRQQLEGNVSSRERAAA